jgi:hypothetical protein
MKNAIVLAVSALFAATAFAVPPCATTSSLTAGTVGIAGVSSSIGGTASAGLNGGSSQSGAESLQTATVGVLANTNIPGGNINGAQSATIGAIGSTASQGYAYNLSTGAAAGSASMTGTAYQAAAGAGSTQTVGSAGTPGNPGICFSSFGCIVPPTQGTAASSPYIPSGSTSGSESSVAQQAITAGTNQGAAIASVSGGNFGSDVGFTTNNESISVPQSGNTVTTESGPGIQLTAGSVGGTYAQTITTDGVYANGSAVDFGGNSNQISLAGSHPAVTNSATGSFSAAASIDGSVSQGNVTGVNVQNPIN